MSRRGMWLAAGFVSAGAVILASALWIEDRVFTPVVVRERPPLQQDLAAAPEVDAGPVLATTFAVEDDIDWAAAASDRLAAGDLESALYALEEALLANPDDASLHWKVARLRDDRVGERSLAAIIKLSPIDQEAPLELARRLLARGAHAEALAAAKEATRRNAWAWEPLHLQGRAYFASGQRQKAITAFRRATTRPKAPSHPFNNLGYALLLSGRNDEALDALEAAVDRGPVAHYMLNNLGLAYERASRLDEAELAFVGALELREDDVKAQLNLDRVSRRKDAIIVEREERGIAELYPPWEDDRLDEALQLVPGG